MTKGSPVTRLDGGQSGKLIETDFEIVDKPLDCLSLGIEARENKIRKFFFCPGDWIFFAPIPEGLSTYQALNDLSKEIT